MVTLEGKPLEQVNELEYVDGTVLANIWMTRDIVRIDPKSGQVTGVIDLSALPEEAHPSDDHDAVANGIAYDPIGASPVRHRQAVVASLPDRTGASGELSLSPSHMRYRVRGVHASGTV